MLAQKERDKALSALEPVLFEISKVYRECYLSQGKGALLVYADSVINGHIPNAHDYRTREDVLEIFDDIDSKASLAALLNKYEPRTEGILVLITSINNETSFVTVKLKSWRKANEVMGHN
jgi:hypothetical protein